MDGRGDPPKVGDTSTFDLLLAPGQGGCPASTFPTRGCPQANLS
jgi:hypothetical protein